MENGEFNMGKAAVPKENENHIWEPIAPLAFPSVSGKSGVSLTDIEKCFGSFHKAISNKMDFRETRGDKSDRYGLFGVSTIVFDIKDIKSAFPLLHKTHGDSLICSVELRFTTFTDDDV